MSGRSSKTPVEAAEETVDPVGTWGRRPVIAECAKPQASIAKNPAGTRSTRLASRMEIGAFEVRPMSIIAVRSNATPATATVSDHGGVSPSGVRGTVT